MSSENNANDNKFILHRDVNIKEDITDTETKPKDKIDKTDKSQSNISNEVKQLVYKNRIKLDNKILNELLDNQLIDIEPIFKIYKYNGDLITDFKSDMQEIHAIVCNSINDNPTGFIRTINENYYYDTNATFKPNNITFLETIAGNRNIYESNTFRGTTNKNLYDAYDYELDKEFDKNNVRKFKCGDLIRTPLYAYDIINRHRTINGLFKNDLTFAKVFDYFTSNETEYILNESKKSKYNNDKNLINKYEIVKIPKDVMKLFKQITMYYEDALKYLKLNDKNGYYCYEIDNIKIPVICKHQMMLLQGVPNMDIAIECYKDGICKYCKQEIAGYNVDTLTLPNNSMSVILQFADCFKDSTISGILIKDIGDFIIKNLNHMGISVYNDTECNGFTYLFITKLALQSLKEFNIYPSKIKELINKIAKLLAFLGKSDQDVKEILEDNSIINITSLIEQIKNDINTDIEFAKGHYLLIEDVLFNSSNDRTPRTPIQKIYLTERTKMLDLFKLFKNEYNKLYDFQLNDKFNYERNVDIEELIIKTKLNNNGFKFFMNNYKNYCPVNNIHEFKDKKCKYCGIDYNGKNSEEIYKKYSEIINNVSTNEISANIDISDAKDNTKIILENINKVQDDIFKNTLKNYGLDYAQITDIEILMKNINEEFIKIINELLNINYDDLLNYIKKEPLTNQKKLILYIMNNNITTLENGINILLSHFPLYNPLDFIVAGRERETLTEDIAPEV